MVLHHDVDAFVFASRNNPVGTIETIGNQRVARFELIKHLPEQCRFATLFSGVRTKNQVNQQTRNHRDQADAANDGKPKSFLLRRVLRKHFLVLGRVGGRDGEAINEQDTTAFVGTDCTSATTSCCLRSGSTFCASILRFGGFERFDNRYRERLATRSWLGATVGPGVGVANRFCPALPKDWPLVPRPLCNFASLL